MNNFNDNEDCFGFHSEYYIVPNWREQERPPAERIIIHYHREEILRGYTKFSKYKENIYFLSTYYSDFSVPNGIAILKFDSKEKRTTAMKLNTKEKYQYIAVNRQGYFLYDKQTIALFGFDGREICQHKFGRNIYMECIYIYDNKVIYSETKTTESKICCVDMLSKKVDILWETQKGDTRFDDTFKLSYKENWGSELQLFKTPSNVGNICCVFLYANRERVVAGYTRNEGSRGHISYIINIENNGSWSLLDCFASQSGYWRKQYNLPPKNARHIFSFHMLDDSMWVKTNDSDIKLVPAPIQKITQLQGSCPVKWELGKLEDYKREDFYFDGKYAYYPTNFELYMIKNTGEKIGMYFHNYDTRCFWCLDDVYVIPNQYNSVAFRDKKTIYNYTDNPDNMYELHWFEFEELISHATVLQSNAKKKTENTPKQLQNVKDIVDKGLPNDVIQRILQEFDRKVAEYLDSIPNSGETDFKEEEGKVLFGWKSQITLSEFRQTVSSITGFREELLAYRKSLSNSWDYNAYVGILLGVGGSKHGDAACQNFAIGQGDNGNNTRKTLENKGLMQVFEKYKGKKLDDSVRLADVEQEICSIVPEYAAIRQKLNEVVFSQIDL